MKIGLIGYGKMGQLIETMIDPNSHIIVSKGRLKDMPEDVDVYIDFSHPSAVLENIQECCHRQTPLVMGTSGWYQDLNKVQQLVTQAGIGFIFAHNFSIGVNLFLNIVRYASRLLNPFDQYDVSGIEIHHRHKADSPSGTAISLAEAILKEIPRKKVVQYNIPEGKIKLEELHFTSLRNGSNPGMHQIRFDSPSETIDLTLQARNREGYALGAIQAAEWIVNKQGFYHFQDMLYET